MKYLHTYLFIIVSCFFSYGQDITSTVIQPTLSEDCKNGQIDLHVSGGFEPYEFSWSNNNWPNNKTSQDLSELEPGEYKVTVTDALCGTAELTFNLVCACEILIVLDNIKAPECRDEYEIECVGSIDIHIEGITDYELLWTYPDGTTSTDEDIYDLCPFEERYKVEVTSVGGAVCFATRYFKICCCEFLTIEPNGNPLLCNQESTGNINPREDYGPPSINGATDGWIRLLDLPNDPNLSVRWTGPNGYNQVDRTAIFNLGAGEYCYEIFAFGCNNGAGTPIAEGCIVLIDGCENSEEILETLEISKNWPWWCKDNGYFLFEDPAGWWGRGWTITLEGKTLSTSPGNNRIKFDNLSVTYSAGLTTPTKLCVFTIIDPYGCMHTLTRTLLGDQSCTITDQDFDNCQQTRECGPCPPLTITGEITGPYYVNPENCNEQSWFCSYWGGPIRTEIADPPKEPEVNYRDCVLTEFCAYGGETETPGVISEFHVLQLHPGEDPHNKESYYCATVAGCTFYDSINEKYVEYVDPHAPIIPSFLQLTAVTNALFPKCEGEGLCLYNIKCGETPIGRLCLTGNCSLRLSNTKSDKNKNSYITYPNPFETSLNLSCDILTDRELIKLQFSDFNGRLIFEVDFLLSFGQHQLHLNIPPTLATGFYFLKITDSFGTENIKLVKPHL